MARYFVGLDVHLSHTSVCILDRNGKRVKRLTLRGAWSGVVDELAPRLGSAMEIVELPGMAGIDTPIDAEVPAFVDRLTAVDRESTINGVIEAQDPVIALHERNEAVRSHHARRAERDGPGTPG